LQAISEYSCVVFMFSPNLAFNMYVTSITFSQNLLSFSPKKCSIEMENLIKKNHQTLRTNWVETCAIKVSRKKVKWISQLLTHNVHRPYIKNILSFMVAYLLKVWLVSKQSSIAILQISGSLIRVVGNALDVVNRCAEKFIFEETRIGEAVSSWFSTLTLLLWLRRVFVWSLKKRKICLPTVVVSVN
jgi:hypothetical protein